MTIPTRRAAVGGPAERANGGGDVAPGGGDAGLG